jgi:hypothetical protein
MSIQDDSEVDAAPEETTMPSGALTVGRVIAMTGDGVLVAVGERRPRLYRLRHSAIRLAREDLGKQVVLQQSVSFDGGGETEWFLLGRLSAAPWEQDGEPSPGSEALELGLDRDLILRVGRATLTLTMAGTIALEGEYVVPDAAGTNRIRGATVEIN